MKSLKESLLDDEDEIIGKLNTKPLIEEWLKENLKSGISSIKISDEPNKEGKYEVSSKRTIEYKRSMHLTSLTNDLFIWDAVGGDFKCLGCHSLQTLEGAPKEVGKNFYCTYCPSLKTLEGSPRKVGDFFSCAHCDSLQTLEGAPKEVGKNFYCTYCPSLKTLEGSPKKVGGDFDCIDCKSLKTLEGAPEKVGGDFWCGGCAKQFTEDEVKSVCDVKGILYI